ncbi:helix-turn-helix transcriptional regulator [Maricaulis maris]|uniref:Putative DNA-binding transcriptional regulator YafY n=1 Tax=Maricaulis maris TaxID=74318 RepID=A0A495DM81_9PROT|nr:WYL domain-containing protein [Maricaulis maris]RKR02836.1 putative DNA-binding transcriptional regulator YafY [Maricaulis maris]
MSFSKAVDLLRLARLATSFNGISLSEIEAEFGCVRRTAQRMTQALEQVFPDTEDHVDGEGIKRWRVPRRRVGEFFAPQADEVAALELALSTLQRDGLGREAGQLRSLRSKIDLLMPDRGRARVEADEEALLEAMGHAARPGPQPASDPQVDAAIADALKGPFVLKIRYRGRRDETARDRWIEPYGLLLGARRYLVGRDRDRTDGHMRHFRVEDIEQAEATADWFAREDGFDFDAYANRAFGVFQDEREFGEVVWKFSPDAAPHAARYRFHPGQTSQTGEDGALTVRFEACGWLEMCWHLYAWGDQVEVLAPPELAEMVRDHRRSDFPGLP